MILSQDARPMRHVGAPIGHYRWAAIRIPKGADAGLSSVAATVEEVVGTAPQPIIRTC
jgi:hypothetical protein